MRGGAQRALQTGAGDFKRVMAGQWVVMVELATDQPGGQRNGFEVDSAGAAGGGVDGDAQGATTELEVVQVELEVGNDGLDQGTDTLEIACIAHFRPPFDK